MCSLPTFYDVSSCSLCFLFLFIESFCEKNGWQSLQVDKPQVQDEVLDRIRITLTSQNVNALEKVSAQLIKGAKEENLV
uniref:Uncharacterized protein n=1 Tax=Ditylenchus dipsaci TaxID=166011 RepID=A0A915DGL1_9BILA